MTQSPNNFFDTVKGNAQSLHKDVNLQKRIITGLIISPLFIVTPWISHLLFQAVLWTALGICLREWMQMVLLEPSQKDVAVGFGVSGLLFAVTILFSPAISCLLMILIAVLIANVTRFSATDRLWLSFGLIYLSLAVYALTILVENPEWGPMSIMFMLAAVCAGDIGAYFVGKMLGGPRLWPEVSPKKTWSGFFGGLVCSVIAGIVFSIVVHSNHFFMTMITMIFITLCGKAGDLLESWIKRRHKIKDTGTLLPGHGGLLDRVDGYLLAGPVLLILLYMMRPVVPW